MVISTLRLDVDGTLTVMEVDPSLEEMQAVVGGYIEPMPMPWGQMIVNEEGLIRQLPANTRASMLANHGIVGTVVLKINEGYELFEDGPI